MKPIKHIVAISTLLLTMSACNSTKSIMIDVRQPAKVNFPEYIGSVAVVDNSAIYPEADSVPEAKVINESRQHYLRALTQFLADEQFFATVKLDTIPLRADDEIENIYFMAPVKIQKLVASNEVDAIISIDQFRGITVPVTIAQFPYNSPNITMNNLQIVCSIYDDNGNKLGTSFTLSSDTLFLMSAHGSPFTDKEFTKDCAIRLADSTTKTLLPYWQKQERLIYINNTANKKQALAYVNEGNWKEAALAWGADFDKTGNKLMKSQLASNIALANEMIGDYDNALKWIDIAMEQLEGNTGSTLYKNMEWYKDKLSNRKEQVELIQTQLQG